LTEISHEGVGIAYVEDNVIGLSHTEPVTAQLGFPLHFNSQSGAEQLAYRMDDSADDAEHLGYRMDNSTDDAEHLGYRMDDSADDAEHLGYRMDVREDDAEHLGYRMDDSADDAEHLGYRMDVRQDDAEHLGDGMDDAQHLDNVDDAEHLGDGMDDDAEYGDSLYCQCAHEDEGDSPYCQCAHEEEGDSPYCQCAHEEEGDSPYCQCAYEDDEPVLTGQRGTLPDELLYQMRLPNDTNFEALKGGKLDVNAKLDLIGVCIDYMFNTRGNYHDMNAYVVDGVLSESWTPKSRRFNHLSTKMYFDNMDKQEYFNNDATELFKPLQNLLAIFKKRVLAVLTTIDSDVNNEDNVIHGPDPVFEFGMDMATHSDALKLIQALYGKDPPLNAPTGGRQFDTHLQYVCQAMRKDNNHRAINAMFRLYPKTMWQLVSIYNACTVSFASLGGEQSDMTTVEKNKVTWEIPAQLLKDVNKWLQKLSHKEKAINFQNRILPTNKYMLDEPMSVLLVKAVADAKGALEGVRIVPDLTRVVENKNYKVKTGSKKKPLTKNRTTVQRLRGINSEKEERAEESRTEAEEAVAKKAAEAKEAASPTIEK
jgi:hypothetical protein